MPKETKTRTVADIQAAVAAKLPYYEGQLNKFKANLDDNPEYAFSWGNGAVEAGVRLWALKNLLAFAETDFSKRETVTSEEQWVAMVTDHFRREAARMSQDMPSSTSHMSNLVDNLKRVYYCRLVAWLDGEHFTSL